jgi:hypothetical protein
MIDENEPLPPPAPPAQNGAAGEKDDTCGPREAPDPAIAEKTALLFHTKESVVPRLLGVPRAAVRELRKKLAEEVHFKKKGRIIAYSDSGLDELLRLLQAQSTSPGAASAQCSAFAEAVKEVPAEYVRIVRVPPNPYVVIAQRDGEANQLTVRVPKLPFWKVGMRIRVRLVPTPERFDLFDFVGQPPRRFGEVRK